MQPSAVHLSALLKDIAHIAKTNDVLIRAVQTDSRQVTEGDLFIAMPGADKHGLAYLNAVVEAGARCIVFDKHSAKDFLLALDACKEKIIQIEVSAVQDVAGPVISRFYANPSQQLAVIAVTGTDGKTSVSRFIAQALSAKMKTAVIGTTGNGIWGELTTATHTTPDVLNLHKIIYEMKEKSAECIVMEVSSHGIEQKRIAGVDIKTAVLTNVTRDHLDYHGTIENYQAVKRQLFLQQSVKNVVLNLDDEIGRELADLLSNKKNVWAYAMKKQAVTTANVVSLAALQVKENGFVAEVVTPDGATKLIIPLLGRFNVANILALLCVLLINEFKLCDACKEIEKLETAPGRMELFEAPGKTKIVVDYAHTPKALELALQALAEHSKGKVWCVFGCGGDRDQGKRALMAAAAEQYADVVIVTDDNPRNENSQDIVEQILSGFEQKEKVEVINDRKAAIEYAYMHAANDDVVLVAGKGHEQYQLVGTDKIPFSDRAEAFRLMAGNSI